MQMRRFVISLLILGVFSPALFQHAARAQQTQNTTTQFSYDPQGNQLSIVDPNLQTTTQQFDALNRRTTVVQPAPTTGGTTPTISVAYDGRDNTISVRDPRNLTTSYVIDGLGNMTQLHSPDTGTSQQTYDAIGNLKTSMDARGLMTTYGYDVLNRITSIVYASGTSTTFQYDGGATPVQFDIGHLTQVADESGSTRLYFDGFGRVIKKVQTTSNPSTVQTVLYGYSETSTTTGKLISITYPSGSVVAYSYDAAGRVASIVVTNTVSGVTATSTLMSGITYNPFGVATAWTWGNGTAFSRTFDLDGRLSAYPLGSLATPNSLTRTVSYDPASRILNFVHADSSGSKTSALATGSNITYGFDNLNRLTAFTPSTTSQSYGYDLTGNRTTTTIGASTFTDAIASSSNQMLSTTGPTPAKSNSFDLDGNLTSDSTVSYVYSARGRMSSSTSTANGAVSYQYNGLGQRTYKSGPAAIVPTGITRYVYDEAGHVLGEYAASGALESETVYLGDLPVAVLRPN